MPYLYLIISFYKSLEAKNCPRVSIEELENWDGQRGDYKKGRWVCYDSYLNYVANKDNFYQYRMVVEANIDDYKTINESVQFAFNKVKEYVEKEVQERILVFNRYQEFLDTGGFPIRKSEVK